MCAMSIKEKLPKVMIILLALSLVLSACAPTTAVDDTPSLEENSISVADIPVATGPLASCTAVSAASRDEALANSPFEAVSEADWQRGNADAEVTFI